jgi:hypothetical protein
MIDLTATPKFELGTIHDTLFTLSIKETKNFVIGHINKHPEAGGWFWFAGVQVSVLYATKDEAIESLVHTYITKTMDKMSKKLNIFNDENYTKRG